MEWYGWLLLILAALSTIALVIILVFKSRPIVHGLSEEERNALINLEKKRMEKELLIEREKSEKLANIADELKSHLKMLQTWYEESMEGIDESRRTEFETYLGDPDAAGDQLDDILGIGTTTARGEEDSTGKRTLVSL